MSWVWEGTVMTLNPRKSPTLFSVLCAGLTLFIVGCFPIWTQTHYLLTPADFQKPPPPATIFECAISFRDDTQRGRPPLVLLFGEYRRDFRMMVRALLAGAVAGRLFYGLLWGRRRDLQSTAEK
jgi:hypothetical protein